jgi:hypothetical protein
MRTYDKLIAHIHERRSPARSRPRFGVISQRYLDARATSPRAARIHSQHP